MNNNPMHVSAPIDIIQPQNTNTTNIPNRPKSIITPFRTVTQLLSLHHSGSNVNDSLSDNKGEVFFME